MIGTFWYRPQGHLQAQGGVGKWRFESMASKVLKLLIWFLGILINILTLRKYMISTLWNLSQGHPQAQRGVGQWSPETLASTVMKLLNMIFGYCFQHKSPMKKHYCTDTTLRASFRLTRLLENGILGLGIQSLETWISGFCSTYRAIEIF